METISSHDSKLRLAREAEFTRVSVLQEELANRQTSGEVLCPQADWWQGCNVSNLACWPKRFFPRPAAGVKGLCHRRVSPVSSSIIYSSCIIYSSSVLYCL